MEYRLENNYLLKLLNSIGSEFVDDLKQELRTLDKSATGDLINSINYKVIESNGVYNIEIYSEDYLKYVDGGRRPGKRPPISAIKPWVMAKGIKIPNKSGGFITTESAAFIIAKSIGEKGIKPTNVISKVQKALFQKYEPSIKIAIQQDYQEYIKKMFSDI
jgi:hypothetical protein